MEELEKRIRHEIKHFDDIKPTEFTVKDCYEVKILHRLVISFLNKEKFNFNDLKSSEKEFTEEENVRVVRDIFRKK